MITKEGVVKILSGNHFLKSWETLADEILALDKKEEFPKYKKYIGINYAFGNFPNGKIFPLNSQVDLDNLDRKNWTVCSKEEFDKQQLQEQISKLEHGKWYKLVTYSNYKYLFCFKNIYDNYITSIKCFNFGSFREESGIVTNIYSGNNINIQSITPVKNEEVEKYFPDEFKVKLDYEILEFTSKNSGCIAVKNNKGTYDSDNFINLKESELLSDSRSLITKIKRLSDGEVFTVGDYFTYTPNGNKHKILSITNGSNVGLIIHGENNCSAIEGYGFNKIIKAKTPILVTEDGVEMFKGDKFWHVDSYWNIGVGCLTKDTFEKLKRYKEFSTKEAAEEYILMNKKCYSVNDIIELGLNTYGPNNSFGDVDCVKRQASYFIFGKNIVK